MGGETHALCVCFCWCDSVCVSAREGLFLAVSPHNELLHTCMGTSSTLPSPPTHTLTGTNGYAEPLTPEQQHQAFLSRLLLMLGSFVIMCLLLF